MDRQKRLHRLGYALSIAIALATTTAQAATSFSLTLDFTGGGLSASQQAVFGDAAAFWEGHITGYQPGINGISGITIDASGTPIDGAGGTLGQAGPRTATHTGGYWLATGGTMEFDTADLTTMESDGSLYDVVLHEMAHVMGFGTLWTNNNVYVDGTGEYTGANGVATYRNEFAQPGATFVPVELGGSAGTANGHWDEVNGGSGLTHITDSLGRDMRDELMTGWLNDPANIFVSRTTLASFTDIGFVAVPEPTGAVLLLIGVAGIVVRRRWRGETAA